MVRRLASIIVLLSICLVLPIASWSAQADMTAYFFDVGQAEATLLQGPDFTILIDTGNQGNDDLLPLLQSAGITEIDLLIGTHPHADHIGQFVEVLQTIPVREVWLPGYEHTTPLFFDVIDAILESEAAYYEPRAGETFDFGSLRLEVINPKNISEDIHESCIAVRAVYKDVAILFTGDAEQQTEEQIVQRGHVLKSQILQLGHHGSRTSTSQALLDAVQSEVAIYSAGRRNAYRHPHPEPIESILREGITLYGTDAHGTIVVETDGITYDIIPEVIWPIDGCLFGQVNINTASLEQLERIVHIGPERAKELANLRPFESLDDMLQITGIGAQRLEDIKEQGIACVGE